MPSTHYNAFISYRHSPLDSKIAGRIQRQLERFHVPRAIRKTTGIQKIQRVFRDQEELPLSVDLGDDINQALANSDFLILICSPRTRESLWVQREISLFLETHSRDRVLTVLAEGEPQDVVPEILQEGREPLSCDYRLPPRKARQIELPRLAAALLGCRYDDLRQRQRQYRTRRLTALFSAALAAALCLALYFFRTSREIQANYLEALRNQSKYLSTASRERLDAGDRLTALQLALAALPTQDKPRPWVPEAEYALGCAVNAYASSSDSSNITAVAAFSHAGVVTGFFTDDAGTRLISWDNTDTISVWDTHTFRLLRTISPGFTPNQVQPGPDDSLLVTDWDQAACYDIATGSLLWSRTADDYTTQEALLSPDRTVLALVEGTTFTLLDSRSGQVRGAFTLPETPEALENDSCTALTPKCFSQDGTLLACTASASFSETGVVVCSLAGGAAQYGDVAYDYLATMCFTADGLLLCAGCLELGDSSMGYLDMTLQVPSQTDLVCLDPATGETVWTEAVPYYMIDFGTRLGVLPYHDNAGILRDAVYCVTSNVCVFLDAATGQVLSRCEMPSPAMSVSENGERLTAVLRDGQLCSITPAAASCLSRPLFASDISAAERKDGYYVLPRFSYNIYLYRPVTDDSWEPFAGDPGFSYTSTARVCGGLAILETSDRLLAYDVADRAFRWELPLADGSYYYRFLGLSPDGSRLLYWHKACGTGEARTPDALIRVDLSTGREEETPLPCETDSSLSFLNGSVRLCGTRLAYVVDGFETNTLHLLDPDSGELETILLSLENYTDALKYILPDPTGARIFLMRGTRACQILDLETGALTDLAQPMDASLYLDELAAVWSEDGRFLAYPGSESICLWKSDGSLVAELPCNGQEPVSLCFTPAGDTLLVLYTNTALYRFSTETGAPLGRTELSYYYGGLSSSDKVSWDFTPQGLMVQMSTLCNLVETDTWAVYAYVPSCLCYSPDQDAFCISLEQDSDEYILGCYTRYSTQALIAKAEEILGDNQLTEEQKSEYGIQ